MYHAIACLTVPKLSYLGYMYPRDFHEKCPQQQNFDSEPKESWHSNHIAINNGNMAINNGT